jgi:hypothetical protein
MIVFNHDNNCKEQLEDISQFIYKWYDFKGDEHGNINIDENIPMPLMWFHKCYKNVLHKLFAFNKLVQSNRLSVKNGFVTFLIECQGVYIWKTEIEPENSKVFMCETKQPIKCQLEGGCEINCVNGHRIDKLFDRKGILWTRRRRNNL